MRLAVKSAQRSRACSRVQNSGRPDLALLPHDPVDERGVVDATVEDQAEGVVPAAPGREPVGEQQRAGGDPQRELLLDLTGHGHLRRLADLDHASGEVPVALVGQVAQQDAVVRVAHQELADRALAGKEGVEQGAEALRLVRGYVGDKPRVDDAVLTRVDPARDPLLAQPAERRRTLRRDVPGSTYASTRWAPSSKAEATVSRTASMVVEAVHEMRTTPSPTGVLSVSLTRSSLVSGGSQPDRAQRRERDCRRRRLVVPALVGGGDGPEVADAGAGSRRRRRC